MKNLWISRRENFKMRAFSLLAPFLALFLLFASQGCKKEISSIGLNLRDDLLNATFSDSTTLIAYSVEEDTLNTTNLIYNYLGYLKDYTFGTTTAGLFTQLIPASNNVNFGDSPVLDSIVLTLRYSGSFYGDTLNPFKVSVYEITESMSADQYFQNSTLEYNSNNLTYKSNFLLYPKPNSKVNLDTIYEAHIRIRLNDDLGNSFLSNASRMSSAADFKEFFKGLYIFAEPYNNNGSFVNVNLTNDLSGIKLYYKRNGEPYQFSFVIKSPDAKRFSRYEHNYNAGTSEFVRQVKNNETSLGEKRLYLQAMGGIKTKISFPFIKDLRNKKVIINKAELVITNIEDETTLSRFMQPDKLSIYRIDKDKDTQVFLPDDEVYMGQPYWGGNYDEKEKEYRFRITRFIQTVINSDKFEPFIYLTAAQAPASASRLIFGGTHPDDTVSRLRLELYYTEY